jgi:rfaE bifunctional protein nucleotidyltransferase chain/domain
MAIDSIIEEARKQHKIIVFTNGCFDILHRGHCTYLAEAKMLGDILIVGLNTDASIRRIKGENRPINNQEDRAYVLSALKAVDYVILFDEDTPKKIISQIMPDVLVKGGDYKIEDIVGADIVTNNGGKVVTIPFVNGYSTTHIIQSIEQTK